MPSLSSLLALNIVGAKLSAIASQSRDQQRLQHEMIQQHHHPAISSSSNVIIQQHHHPAISSSSNIIIQQYHHPTTSLSSNISIRQHHHSATSSSARNHGQCIHDTRGKALNLVGAQPKKHCQTSPANQFGLWDLQLQSSEIQRNQK
jgi:hypothetical protein